MLDDVPEEFSPPQETSQDTTEATPNEQGS